MTKNTESSHLDNRAKYIIETLPYIKEFYQHTIVIKYGGNAMTDENLKRAFALNIVLLKYVGIRPIIVHGGGPQIGSMLSSLKIESHFLEGFRVTDDATMDVVEMVLAGQVNKNIVNLLNLQGGNAVGLSGKDANLIEAEQKILVVKKDGAGAETLDLGKVGNVKKINTEILQTLIENDFIPVIAPIGVDKEGRTYNINADTVASAVAIAMRAKRLHLLTNTLGLLDTKGELISSLSTETAKKYLADGTEIGRASCRERVLRLV